jgi:hypothetical protein
MGAKNVSNRSYSAINKRGRNCMTDTYLCFTVLRQLNELTEGSLIVMLCLHL